MKAVNPKYRGIPTVTKPRGRNKPLRKKLAQRSTYGVGYAKELTTRYVEPRSIEVATPKTSTAAVPYMV